MMEYLSASGFVVFTFGLLFINFDAFPLSILGFSSFFAAKFLTLEAAFWCKLPGAGVAAGSAGGSAAAASSSAFAFAGVAVAFMSFFSYLAASLLFFVFSLASLNSAALLSFSAFSFFSCFDSFDFDYFSLSSFFTFSAFFSTFFTAVITLFVFLAFAIASFTTLSYNVFYSSFFLTNGFAFSIVFVIAGSIFSSAIASVFEVSEFILFSVSTWPSAILYVEIVFLSFSTFFCIDSGVHLSATNLYTS